MWQYQIEIVYYFIMYFVTISAFKVFVQGEAHTCFVDTWMPKASMKYVWAPPSTEAQWYNESEIHSGITFGSIQSCPKFIHFQVFYETRALFSTQDCYMFFSSCMQPCSGMLYITSEATVADTQLFCNQNLSSMPLKWPRVEPELSVHCPHFGEIRM